MHSCVRNRGWGRKCCDAAIYLLTQLQVVKPTRRRAAKLLCAAYDARARIALLGVAAPLSALPDAWNSIRAARRADLPDNASETKAASLVKIVARAFQDRGLHLPQVTSPGLTRPGKRTHVVMIADCLSGCSDTIESIYAERFESRPGHHLSVFPFCFGDTVVPGVTARNTQLLDWNTILTCRTKHGSLAEILRQTSGDLRLACACWKLYGESIMLSCVPCVCVLCLGNDVESAVIGLPPDFVQDAKCTCDLEAWLTSFPYCNDKQAKRQPSTLTVVAPQSAQEVTAVVSAVANFTEERALETDDSFFVVHISHRNSSISTRTPSPFQAFVLSCNAQNETAQQSGFVSTFPRRMVSTHDLALSTLEGLLCRHHANALNDVFQQRARLLAVPAMHLEFSSCDCSSVATVVIENGDSHGPKASAAIISWVPQPIADLALVQPQFVIARGDKGLVVVDFYPVQYGASKQAMVSDAASSLPVAVQYAFNENECTLEDWLSRSLAQASVAMR